MKHLLLAAMIAMALAGCSDNEPPKNASAKQDKADLAAGKALAERECKTCHGLDGRGVAPAIPTLAGQRERYLVTALTEYRDGKRAHAALREIASRMSEADARNLAAYFASLPPVAPASATYVQVFSPYDNGKKLSAPCAACHAEDGNSNIPGTPSLAGQQSRYFVAAVQEYLNGAREASPMHSLVRDLSKLDVESVGLYFASQTPAERPATPNGNAAAGEPSIVLCAGCHGPGGVSDDAATPNLAGQDAQYLTRAIAAYRKARKHEAMQRAVAGLSDGDIENIAAYYSIQKSRPAESGLALIKQITEKCDRCHGSEADNPALVVPKLNGQDADYLTMAMRAYRDGRRHSSVMHSVSWPYGDAIIEAISSFYASQPPK
jgi:cytochrome c553